MVATEDLHIDTAAQSPVNEPDRRNSSDGAGNPITPVESPLIEYQVWCDDTEGREEHFESETPFPQESFKKSVDGKELRKTSLGGSPAISVVRWVEGNWPKSSKRSEEKKDPESPKSPVQPPVKFEDVKISHVFDESVIIRSEALKETIRNCVKYYPLVLLTGENIEIFEPYEVLVHHIQELEKVQNNSQTGARLSKELKTLLDHVRAFIKPYHGPLMQRLQHLQASIAYKDLWLIFKPGVEVYWRNRYQHFPDVIQSGIVKYTKYVPVKGRYEEYPGNFKIILWSLQTDGQYVGRNRDRQRINTYKGEQRISSLPIYPCFYRDMEDNGATRKKLIERGHNTYQLLREMPMHKSYEGMTYAKQKKAYRGSCTIDIDFYLQESESSNTSDGWNHPFLLDEVTPSSKNSDMDGQEMPDFIFASFHHLDLSTTESLPTDQHYFLLTPMIAGFGVQDKKWYIFFSDTIKSVIPCEDAMDNLVIDPVNREVIEAVVHVQSQPVQIDQMEKKGKGQVALLHGSPGVGKTYTVECIAQSTGRPLISLSMGNIVHEGKDVETELMFWFSLSERWRAILLLDEADIFLERRATRDIQRNGIVSVFLRRLEYFSGLLFLTTNRVGHIDDAFISRASIVLQYANLTDDSRQKIWEGLFARLPEQAEEVPTLVGKRIEVSRYAEEYVLNDKVVQSLHWNGREIRNALQTAISLATYKAQKDGKNRDGVIVVKTEHFQKVVDMSRKFKDYLQAITKKDEEARAAARNDRPNVGYLSASEAASILQT